MLCLVPATLDCGLTVHTGSQKNLYKIGTQLENHLSNVKKLSQLALDLSQIWSLPCRVCWRVEPLPTTTTTTTQCKKHSGEHLPVHTLPAPHQCFWCLFAAWSLVSHVCMGNMESLGLGRASHHHSSTPQASHLLLSHWPRLILKSFSELRSLICVWHWPGSVFSLDCYLLLVLDCCPLRLTTASLLEPLTSLFSLSFVVLWGLSLLTVFSPGLFVGYPLCFPPKPPSAHLHISTHWSTGQSAYVLVYRFQGVNLCEIQPTLTHASSLQSPGIEWKA